MIHAVVFVLSGLASWYSRESSSCCTSIGQPMINSRHTCATRRLVPYGTRLIIVNDRNGRESWCIVNDYGPQASTGRILDVSPIVARDLDMISAGVVPVRIYRQILVKGSPRWRCPHGICGTKVRIPI